MVHIPIQMGNEESRIVAAMVATERRLLIAQGYHQAAVRRARKFYEGKSNER